MAKHQSWQKWVFGGFWWYSLTLRRSSSEKLYKCFIWRVWSLTFDSTIDALWVWTSAAATRAPKLCLSRFRLPPGLPSPSTARTGVTGVFEASFETSKSLETSFDSPETWASVSESSGASLVRRFLLGCELMALNGHSDREKAWFDTL